MVWLVGADTLQSVWSVSIQLLLKLANRLPEAANSVVVWPIAARVASGQQPPPPHGRLGQLAGEVRQAAHSAETVGLQKRYPRNL